MSTPLHPRRAFWSDLRFVIGLGLVAAAIGGVWLVVSSAGSTTPVYQANRTIVLGETITADDLRPVEANLGALTDDYVSPSTLRPGVVSARTLDEGELVPRSALVDQDSRRTTTVVVTSSTGVPHDVAAGTVVELWETPVAADDGAPVPPRVVVGDAIVHALVDDDAVLDTGNAAVELTVARAAVADVLAAISSGAALSIVPVGTR
ncbi:hypothetical protein [Microbacterium sp. NPDC089695]|uniref:hypothetical protein n=1 Tax=Microbacterium sp. NPDC089695 TaxID=3364198 RepID=UPI003827B709